jgi:hypothetical protein
VLKSMPPFVPVADCLEEAQVGTPLAADLSRPPRGLDDGVEVAGGQAHQLLAVAVLSAVSCGRFWPLSETTFSTPLRCVGGSPER